MSMANVRFGSTGLHVSRMALGTMTFGGQTDGRAAFEILDKAVASGVNLIDTANVYPFGKDMARNGTSETIIGSWFASNQGARRKILLATKAGGKMGPSSWEAGASRKNLLDSLDASLRRLQTDYVDVFQIHHDDAGTELEETLECLDLIVKSGRARYIGLSNYLAYRVALCVGIARARQFTSLSSVQCRYSLLFREMERELFLLADETGLAVLAYNPLAGGLLSGKYSAGAELAGARFGLGQESAAYRQRYWNERCLDATEKLNNVAADFGVPLTTLSIAWVLANPGVTSCILGASRADQLDDTLRGASYALPEDAKARLNDLTHEFRMGDAPR